MDQGKLLWQPNKMLVDTNSAVNFLPTGQQQQQHGLSARDLHSEVKKWLPLRWVPLLAYVTVARNGEAALVSSKSEYASEKENLLRSMKEKIGFLLGSVVTKKFLKKALSAGKVDLNNVESSLYDYVKRKLHKKVFKK